MTTIQRGFNLRFPYPIETVEIVDVETIQAFNVGQGTSEALMLTKDKSICKKGVLLCRVWKRKTAV